MPKGAYLSSAKYFSWYVYVTLLHMYPTFISLFFLKILSKLRYVRISMKCNIFSFSWFWWKIMSKSAYVWILNTCKKCWFSIFFWKNVEIPMYETFKKVSFFNFCRKNHHQNPHRYVFEFFLYTKSISRYYRNYRLFIRYSCYQSKNFTFFFVFSTHFPHSWRVEISLFSIIFTIVQTPTPPLSVLLRKRQKVPKFYLSVFWQKIENPSLCWENVFFEIFEKNVLMGILMKMSKNLPVV